MLRHAHFYMKGGKQPFAASAKSKGQREESGRPEYPADFSVVQSAANGSCEPNCRMLNAPPVGFAIVMRFLSLKIESLLAIIEAELNLANPTPP
jgi:hypothetical protein